MLTWFTGAAIVAAVLIVSTTDAQSQSTVWQECAAQDPRRSISACTKFLRSFGNAKPVTRAVAFFNRGKAYQRKGDLDHALSDLNESIRLDPRRAFRYQDRGDIYLSKG